MILLILWHKSVSILQKRRLSIAWIAEENPGIRPLDVCSGPYISAGSVDCQIFDPTHRFYQKFQFLTQIWIVNYYQNCDLTDIPDVLEILNNI